MNFQLPCKAVLYPPRRCSARYTVLAHVLSWPTLRARTWAQISIWAIWATSLKWSSAWEPWLIFHSSLWLPKVQLSNRPNKTYHMNVWLYVSSVWFVKCTNYYTIVVYSLTTAISFIISVNWSSDHELIEICDGRKGKSIDRWAAEIICSIVQPSTLTMSHNPHFNRAVTMQCRSLIVTAQFPIRMSLLWWNIVAYFCE